MIRVAETVSIPETSSHGVGTSSCWLPIFSGSSRTGIQPVILSRLRERGKARS